LILVKPSNTLENKSLRNGKGLLAQPPAGEFIPAGMFAVYRSCVEKCFLPQKDVAPTEKKRAYPAGCLPDIGKSLTGYGELSFFKRSSRSHEPSASAL
jgi:hypothetical protein